MTLFSHNWLRIFGMAKDNTHEIEIRFYKEAAPFPEVGLIEVSHRKHKLDHKVVRMAFVGLSKPPAVTPALMARIWNAALEQGYVPHQLVSYGAMIDNTTPEIRFDKTIHDIFSGVTAEARDTTGADGLEQASKEDPASVAMARAVRTLGVINIKQPSE